METQSITEDTLPSSSLPSTVESERTYQKWLCFYINGERYGIMLQQAREIVEVSCIVSIPNTPQYLRGILRLRGNLITVLDLRSKLGMEAIELTSQSRVLIVQVEERSIGLLVDQIEQLRMVEENEISEPPEMFHEDNRSFISGIGRHEEMLITLLDVPALVALPN